MRTNDIFLSDFAFSNALCCIAQRQPIYCCCVLSAVNYPEYVTPSPRHWLLVLVSVSTCCCVALLRSSSLAVLYWESVRYCLHAPLAYLLKFRYYSTSWTSALLSIFFNSLNWHCYLHYPVLNPMMRAWNNGNTLASAKGDFLVSS